ncbi:MAG: hypothetical protein PWP03_186 [Candidatus Woesearchaeota archaeon]|nr:hypothetical protein [Candidatus Woesearchaeota archaeon]
MDEESVKLGNKIELVGFSDLENGEKNIVRKMVGTYLNKFEHKIGEVEKLKLRLKKVHEREDHAVFEMSATLEAPGKVYNADEEGRNLFITLDAVLKKLEAQMH